MSEAPRPDSVTELLRQSQDGNRAALDRLPPLVYEGFIEADWGDRAESPIEPVGGMTGGTFVQEPGNELLMLTDGDWVCPASSGGTGGTFLALRTSFVVR